MTDVVVIGGGLAGSAVAVVLARAGHSVCVVDSRASVPPIFRAEKIEPDQAELLRRLDLFDEIRDAAAPIHEVWSAHAGRVLNRLPIEQYGLLYPDMVNAVRRAWPPTVRFEVGRVHAVRQEGGHASVSLTSGLNLDARLVVVAAGTSRALDKELGIARTVVSAEHSLSFGFTMARCDGETFPFDALTYYADSRDARIDYLTLFRIPGAMRANLFTYSTRSSEWARRFVADPQGELQAALPGLRCLTGHSVVSDALESGAVDLYRLAPPRVAGLVLIGDAGQSVCPATGSGVSKVLTDVEILCRDFIPSWLAQTTVSPDDIDRFYSHPQKVLCDRDSMTAALYRRRAATDRSFRWWVHRRRVLFAQNLRGWLSGTANVGAAGPRVGH